MNVLIKNSRFLRKIIPAKVFGEQFLKIEEEEDTLSEKNYIFINLVKDFILKKI